MELLENLLPYMFIDSLHQSAPDTILSVDNNWQNNWHSGRGILTRHLLTNKAAHWIAATWFCGCFMQQSTEEASMKKSSSHSYILWREVGHGCSILH
jgi:hypothetical protein